MSPLLLLVSLAVVPGLILLALLMEWLETVFAQREVSDNIAQLLLDEIEIDRLEARIASAAEPLFRQANGAG